MNDHYYSPDPRSKSDVRLHEVAALGVKLRFFTDAGVFSKEGLDDGSALMLRSVPPLSGRVLDLGCGWGALGLTLARVNPQAAFVLSDVNARAVDLAEKNRRENGLQNAQVVLSDGFSALEGTFDFILSNPPIRAGKQVVYAMLKQGMGRLNPGGRMVIVIRKQQGAPSALKFLSGLGRAGMTAREKGYWIIECRKEADA